MLSTLENKVAMSSYHCTGVNSFIKNVEFPFFVCAEVTHNIKLKSLICVGLTTTTNKVFLKPTCFL